MFRRLLVPTLLLTLLAAGSLRGGADPAAEPRNESVAELPGDTAVLERPEHPVNPVVVKLREALELEQTRLAELEARAENAATAMEALEIQREMEKLKRGTQARLFELQADRARELGDEAKARELDEQAERILSPAPRRAPSAERPAPDREEGDRS